MSSSNGMPQHSHWGGIIKFNSCQQSLHNASFCICTKPQEGQRGGNIISKNLLVNNDKSIFNMANQIIYAAW